MADICRVLNKDIEVECFVDGILEITEEKEKRRAINAITAAERNIRGYSFVPTLTHEDNRDFAFRDRNKREELRKQIINELINQPQLDNDDHIVLGKGGARPLCGESLAEKKAYYIIGPPASGKSGIASKVANLYGAYILDSDYAKRKLPEYENQIGAASLVHEESDSLIFNYQQGNLLEYCIQNEYNIVIPKIGHNIDKVLQFCSALKKIGYEVFLISVDLDRQQATKRAYYRYMESKRYVPLALIFDAYGNQPTITYFKIKQKNVDTQIFNGFAQISTDVRKGELPILEEEENMPELKKIWEV